MSNRGKGLLTKARFACASGLTPEIVQRMIDDGTIQTDRIRGSSHYLIPVSELQKVRRSNKRK